MADLAIVAVAVVVMAVAMGIACKGIVMRAHGSTPIR